MSQSPVFTNYVGYYATLVALQAAVPTGAKGDWAIVEGDDSIYIWNVADGAWATAAGGDVVGPSSSTQYAAATFSDTTGKDIVSSRFKIVNSGAKDVQLITVDPTGVIEVTNPTLLNPSIPNQAVFGSNLGIVVPTPPIDSFSLFNNDGLVFSFKKSSGVVVDLIDTTSSQTLTNKTLTSPTLTTPTISSGNLNFTNTGRRITGDTTNATVASRLCIVDSNTNSTTYINVLPNGTAVETRVNLFADSNGTAADGLTLVANDTSNYIWSKNDNPLFLQVGATIKAQITTTGIVIRDTYSISSDIANGSTFYLSAYNTTGSSYTNFATMVSGATPSFTLNNVSYLGSSTVQTTVVTTGASYNITDTDNVIIIDKATGSATSVILPAGTNGRQITIKDGKGDAATNNITVSGATNIDGAANYVMNSNRQSLTLVFAGSWQIL